MKKKRNIVFIFVVLLIALLVAAMYFLNYPSSVQIPNFLTQSAVTTQTTTVVQKTTTTQATPTTQSGGGGAPTTTNSPTGTFQPSVVTLEIKSWGFNPNIITIMKGSTATWTNLDSATHTVTSAGNFDSGDIAGGKTWTYTFNKVGTFEYTCKYHPSMKAKVVITES